MAIKKYEQMKVLMVCLGNICRSPIAEGVLKEKVKNLSMNWSVDSAGTSGWHNGSLPDRRSIDIAKTHGIDLTDQRSRKFTKSDFEMFDLILVMDSSNYRDVMSMADTVQDKAKVELLLNYSYPGENRSVPDPYYEGGFSQVFDMISDSCQKVVEQHS